MRKILMPQLLEVKPPECGCSNLDKTPQQDHIFVPSNSPVTHRCKLANNMLPRFLEEEGFYMPQKPYISRNAYHKMENRLLQQEAGKGWFEESGEIMSLPSPIKLSNRCRVPFPVKIDTQLKTKYKKLKALISATTLAESNFKENQRSKNTLKDYRSQIRLTNNSEMDEHKTKLSDEKERCLNLTHVDQTSVDLGERNEPLFIPHLTFLTEISAANMCPLDEQKRRENIKTEKYFIKIYYNNKLVSFTKEASLHQNFKVVFQQMFRIQVLNWPESLRLEVFESSKKKELTKVYLPLPSNFVLKSKDVLDEIEFSCEEQVKPSNGTMGSNVHFVLDENESEELCILTSGKLIYSLSWTVDDRGIPLAPTFQPADIVCHSALRNSYSGNGTGMWWHSDIQKVMDWAKQTKIDPNDPDYSDLFELIMYAKTQEQSDSKYFRLEQLQEEFNFVTAEEIKNCKRFQLLQLRSLGQLGFYCFQQIPLYDREIPDTVFQEYGSQLENDILLTDVDPISAQRNCSANFVRMMKKQVTKRIVTIRHKYNLSDIVSDYEEIISMSQLSNAIFKLGERRRHLKPQRKERRKVPAQAVSDGDVKLLIRILRAYNIPARKAPGTKVVAAHSPSFLPNRMSRGRHTMSGNPAYNADLLSEVSVHPFVEVEFQNTVYRTSTADGSHPCWNEELQVDFISPGHDYTFSGLSKIKDIININIFDEFVIEKHEDACPKSCSGHSYVRKNWLGSVTFPFFALLEQSKVKNKTKLLQRAYIFKQTCKALFPKRRIVTSVFNHQGKSILVTKYITSLNPPQLLLDMYPDDPNSTSDLISRFVSLIPCISDSVDESDDVDIWITSEDCLKLGVANKEEHAVLLCNYFLYVGKKAWILLGTSVLEGKVAYVATQENGEYFLWNPLNGQCYKQFDAFCPLQSIDCLISWENVWFNIQQNSSPMYVSFDISKEGFWKQLFPYYILDLKSQPVQVTGFPIQMPYLDMKSITEAVYQTGIHSSEVPNTEFALAVYIHPYPNTMLSVWIYLVSLVHHHK
ncbi:protein CC2D2B [Varanus komodoensis]|uniref:protein CC2D2B n=1 Tax=Varanus komodoensis TaxID=61221 RepID=UPI001CF79968|nr:protein CC2D2B [Varanus komodoensis]